MQWDAAALSNDNLEYCYVAISQILSITTKIRYDIFLMLLCINITNSVE